MARQGLALRGNNSDAESNLLQLLKLRTEDCPQLCTWLQRERLKYTSHECQNEMLEIMVCTVQRKILSRIIESSFLALMVDETTDVSNKEQLTFVIRRTDADLNVFEEFLGMQELKSTDAESIVLTINTVLLRLGIPITKLRGQCYDGASTMAGAHSSVAAKIQQLEPKAVFIHCYGHALNLSVNDTVKKCNIMRDCLDTCYELIKLIKFSPKRSAMLNSIKKEVGDDAPAVRTLCPTRWTVRAESIGSILANYHSIQNLWDEALEGSLDSEMKARIQGVSSQMEETFQFLFALILAEMVLRHTDNLNKTLQKPELSSPRLQC